MKKKTKTTRLKQKASQEPSGAFKRFQDQLLRKRNDILQIVKKNETGVDLGEIGDEADVASQTFERELMFEMADGERIILDDVEAALRKFEKGDFGICESCHKKIANQRLHAMPWARYCIQCQARSESRR